MDGTYTCLDSHLSNANIAICKQSLVEVFVISGIIKVKERVSSRSRWLRNWEWYDKGFFVIREKPFLLVNLYIAILFFVKRNLDPPSPSPLHLPPLTSPPHLPPTLLHSILTDFILLSAVLWTRQNSSSFTFWLNSKFTLYDFHCLQES